MFRATPSVMLTDLRGRFGHQLLKSMISQEVVKHGGAILRMAAVANLWERHIVSPAPAVVGVEYVGAVALQSVCRLSALSFARPGRKLAVFVRSYSTPDVAGAAGATICDVHMIRCRVPAPARSPWFEDAA